MSIASDFAALRPAGGFQAILADPPWHFETWGEGGARNVTAKSSGSPPGLSTDAGQRRLHGVT